MKLGLYGSDISITDLSNLPKSYNEGSVIMNVDHQYLMYEGKGIFALITERGSDYLRRPEGPWFNSLYIYDSFPKYSYLKTLKNWVCSNF